MKVKFAEAKELFVEMGFDKAAKWDPARVRVKLNSFTEFADNAKAPTTKGLAKLFKKVMTAAEEGEPIELELDPADVPAEVPAEKPAKAPKGEKGEKGEKKPRAKGPTGAREGGVPDLINKAMSASKAKTVTQIAEGSGQDEKRVKSHINYWKKKGGIVEEGEGKFKLVAK